VSTQNGNGYKLTPTQRRLYDLLASDGMIHTVEELVAVMPDPEYSDRLNLNPMLTHIRRVIERGGQTVASVTIQGRTYYQLVEIPSRMD
jgi:protein subunit release factor A